jgi:hypothetical protein
MHTTRHLRLVPDLAVRNSSSESDPLERASLDRVWLHIVNEIDDFQNDAHFQNDALRLNDARFLIDETEL